MIVGVALFEQGKPLERAKGVCVTDGAEVQLQSVRELPKDVLWLTNLPWELHLAISPAKRALIKQEAFLGVPIASLLAELGCTHLELAEKARILATIADRVMRLAARTYGEQFLNLVQASDTLPAAIAKHFYPDSPPHDPPTEFMGDIRACTQDVVVLNRIAESSEVVTLRALTSTHAQAVLATPCPPPHVIPNFIDTAVDADASLAQATGEAGGNAPMLFGIDAITLPKRAKNSITLSPCRSMWGHTKRWLTGPELIALDAIGAAVQVHTVRLLAEDAEPLPAASQIPPLGLSGHLSISCSLLWQCHWLSMATDWLTSWHPPSSLWLRSTDRMRLYAMLAPLTAIKGLTIHQYGEGHVKVSGSEEALIDLIYEAPGRGLAPCPDLWALLPADSHDVLAWAPPSDLTTIQKHVLRTQRWPINDRIVLDEICELALDNEPQATALYRDLVRRLDVQNQPA